MGSDTPWDMKFGSEKKRNIRFSTLSILEEIEKNGKSQLFLVQHFTIGGSTYKQFLWLSNPIGSS